MNKPYLRNTTLSALCLGVSLAVTQTAQAENWNGTASNLALPAPTDRFEEPLAWETNMVVPSSASQQTFQLNTDGSNVVADAATWAYLNTNGLLHSSTQYRGVTRLLFGQTQNNTLQTVSYTHDIGAGNTFLATNGTSHVLGARQYTTTTVNILSGTLNLQADTTVASNADNCTATVNISGGELVISREFLKVGGQPTSIGLVSMTGGSLRTRSGLEISESSIFEVQGSGPTQIGIGSEGSIDGYAIANGTIRTMIDGGGITPIFIDDVEGVSGTSATLNLGSELDVSFINTAAASGTWTVLELENGDIVDNGIVLAAGVDTAIWTFNVDNSGTNGFLTVTAVVPQLTWDGSVNDDWDIATTANWQGAATYSEPSEVIFDDTLTGTGTVNLTDSFSEVSVIVDNPTASYTFSGTGQLTGVAGLIKNGAGTLALSNSGGNDFAGAVNLNAGTLTLGNATAFGGTDGILNVTGGTLDLGGFSVTKGPLKITDGTISNGTLTSSSVTGEAGTINAVLVGDVNTTLTKNEAGTLSLNGDNATFDGDMYINGGILKIGHANALGSPGETETTSVEIIDDVENVKVSDTYSDEDPNVIGVSETVGLQVGDTITGPGIPVGTVVVELDVYAPDTVTMDMDATETAFGVDITFSRQEVTTVTTTTTTGYTSIAVNGTLDLNGQTIAEGFLSIDGTFMNSDITTTAEISEELKGNFGNPTFDGPGDMIFDDIFKEGTGTRRMTKNGAGTLTLGGDEGNNRYGLTVNGGNVNFSKTSGNVVGRFPLIMNAGTGTVKLLNSNQIHEVNDINGIHEINAGTLDLNGFDEVIGSLSTTAGETAGIVTNSNGGSTSNLTLNGTQATVEGVSTPNDVTFPGTISGNLNLIKGADQANTQTLSGVLSYTGNTTVNRGTLEISNAASDLADSSVVTITDGVLNLSNGLTDVVDQLWIDGVQQVSGTYGSTSSAAGTTDDTHFAGTGILSVTSDPSPDDYGDWSTENGLVGGPTDDDDNDSATNEAEYAFGTDPTDGSSLNAYTAVDPATGSFSYTRRNVALTGLTYDYKFSIDLVDFTIGDSYTPGESSDGGDPIETVTVQIPVELLGDKLFMRIEAN